MVKYAFDTNVFIEASRDASAKAAMLAFLDVEGSFTFLSAVVMQELAVGARTKEQARQLDETVVTPFTRRDRVFAPSRGAFLRSGQMLASVATREGWAAVRDNPSLLNDALIAASCREQGITLITRDTDYRRFRPFLRGWTTVTPWPSMSRGARSVDDVSSTRR